MNDAQQTARPRTRRLHRTACLVVAPLAAGSLVGGTAVAAAAGRAEERIPVVRVPSDSMAGAAAVRPGRNLGSTFDTLPDETCPAVQGRIADQRTGGPVDHPSMNSRSCEMS